MIYVQDTETIGLLSTTFRAFEIKWEILQYYSAYYAHFDGSEALKRQQGKMHREGISELGASLKVD